MVLSLKIETCSILLRCELEMCCIRIVGRNSYDAMKNSYNSVSKKLSLLLNCGILIGILLGE